jgi:hypothetical protein
MKRLLNYLRGESASSDLLIVACPAGSTAAELLLPVRRFNLMMSLYLQCLLRYSLHLRTHPK